MSIRRERMLMWLRECPGTFDKVIDVVSRMLRLIVITEDHRERRRILEEYVRGLPEAIRFPDILSAIPEDPREQIRIFADRMHDLQEELRATDNLTVVPEDLRNRLASMWELYGEVSNFVHNLLELQVLGDEEIYGFHQRALDLIEQLLSLLLGITRFMGHGSTIVEIYLNLARRKRLEVENQTTQTQIEENTVSYIYKRILHNTNHEGFADNCAICLCDLEDDDEARRLPCLHFYHKECVDRWLRANWKCPKCRLDIRGQHMELTDHLGSCAAD